MKREENKLFFEKMEKKFPTYTGFSFIVWKQKGGRVDEYGTGMAHFTAKDAGKDLRGRIGADTGNTAALWTACAAEGQHEADSPNGRGRAAVCGRIAGNDFFIECIFFVCI